MDEIAFNELTIYSIVSLGKCISVFSKQLIYNWILEDDVFIG